MGSNLAQLKKRFTQRQTEEMSLEEYLERIKTDPSMYATVYERLLKAIGPPKIIDTSKDERLGRIFGNRMIKTYETFKDFYGAELVIEKIVDFITFASQNLEESKQVLYLKGPVGSAKSSLAIRLKELLEQEPIYALVGSPIQESPLGLFSKKDAEALGIPEYYLGYHPSPLIVKRLHELKGDISKFRVQKLYPSEADQIAIGRVEARDANTQDVSALVGKIDIRKLEHFSADDPECYSYSGGLCRGNRGLVDMVEMFKAEPKILLPMLSATQEKSYKGTEAIGAIPFEGMIIAHSNEKDWQDFKTKNNEAFLDRIYLVNVPYCLRINEEVEIYKKLIRASKLSAAPIAPGTLELLAQFAIVSRIDVDDNSDIITKLHVYNGEHYKDVDPRAKSLREYQQEADPREGLDGISTRDMYKILSQVFNYDLDEIAANPVHLALILEKNMDTLVPNEEARLSALALLKEHFMPEYAELIGKDIQKAYFDSYHEYGQNMFDRYVLFADQWVQDKDYRDPDTGQLMSKKVLEQELQKIEKPAQIGSPKEFRHEVVNFCIRYQSKHNGKNPDWKSWSKIEHVIASNLNVKTEDMLPIMAFGTTQVSKENEQKQKEFLARMKELGYTEKQVKILVDWQMRAAKGAI